MSTTVTLRPSATTGASGWTFGGGGTTVHGVLSDNADATYAMAPNSSSAARVTFPAPTVPAGAQIRGVALRMRWSGNSSVLAGLSLYRFGSTKVYVWSSGSRPGSLATQSFKSVPNDLSGGPWTAYLVSLVSVQMVAASNVVHFVEAYLDVTYNEIPVLTNVGPTGTQSTQNPTITWTYSDPDGDAQERFQVKIFDSATVAASGFNPGSSAALRDSGEVFSADPSWAGSNYTALPAGGYSVYVRAADVGSSGRYSDWVGATFTVVGDPPATPNLISATADTVNGRNVIVVQQADNLLLEQPATADGITGEYTRWVGITNATATPTANAGTGLSGNSIRFTVTAAGAANVKTRGTGTLAHWVIPSSTIAYKGWIKSTSVAGTAHLDVRGYDASGTDLGIISTGSSVTISTSYQSSGGIFTLPANVVTVAIEWNISAAGAGQVYDIDTHEIRLGTAIGARGGLDTRNLLGKNDSDFDTSGTTGNWIRATGATGTLVTVTGVSGTYGLRMLEYQPGSVGASHVLTLSTPLPLPIDGGAFLNAATYQFQAAMRGNVSGLKVALYLVWYDDSNTPVGSASYGGTTTLGTGSFGVAAVAGLAPEGATKFNIQLVLTGETNTTDRWWFTQLAVSRIRYADRNTVPTIWKPSPGVDTWPQVEYSDDAGVTWTNVRGTELMLYDQQTRLATVYDYEAPPNTTRRYRARTAGLDYSLDATVGVALLSGASSTADATLAVTRDFYLIDAYTQTRITLPIVGDFQFSSPEPQAQFDPLGRSHTVTLSDVPKGEIFSFKLAFNSAAEFDAFEAIRQTQHGLYLQTPGTRSWYIKLTGTRSAVLGMGTLALDQQGGKYVVDVTATEIARPG